ncbi:putative N-formylglutamate amidohydrolase [Sphingobium sp. OAS761]|uniref:N-formylglutamate amidohydrolase n=1 Tax=Sphingobium sp. OAS761 TaxID=2817901 RepID=UPI0020A17855|nr:N-formylglutamate amidohydrolase [Sphingobium sp. OAS761]MCP1471011.1 putative N-formylglutamate amidohydrolase [Sphingobium sp. OAS761]
MSEAAIYLEGRGADLLIVADHASSHVPADVDLGIDADLLKQHVAVDIGVAPVARLLSSDHGWPAILGGVSRLVIDLNREPDAPGLLPLSSDGHIISGNRTADLQDRMRRFYHPYHQRLGALLAAMTNPFILSLHSFTPQLQSDPDQLRPWDIGVLYNEDERAARIAIPMLRSAGLKVGDQQPYSGRLLNATMNRHAEAGGIPYLGVEMRQDLVADAAGQRRFADLLAPVVKECRRQLT